MYWLLVILNYVAQENTPIEEVDRELSQIRTQINRMKQKGGIILTGDFNAKIKINKDNIQQTESNKHKPHTNITQTETSPMKNL